MAYIDHLPQMQSSIHTHPLPEPDESFCSCCRKSIISGLHNVVKITIKPERILNTEGEQIGVQGEDRVKAYFHAQCFQENHLPSKKIVECKYCGVFAMAKKLKDGSPITCRCACHTKGQFCSLLLVAQR